MEGFIALSRMVQDRMAADPETFEEVANQMITPQYLTFMQTQIIHMMDSSPDYVNMMRQSVNVARVTRVNLDNELPVEPYVFIPFRTLLSLESFPTRQELLSAGTSFLTPGNGSLWLAIFISHRWESQDHPDQNSAHPDRDNRQLLVLQQFVRMVVAIFKFSRGLAVDGLPNTLAHHGWFQAAFVAGLDSLRSKGHDATSPDELEQLLLDHCGVWYDYSCLYQKPRTPEQQSDFNSSLYNLSRLVRGCSCCIALRDDNDDYMARGWCAWEICAFSTATIGMLTPGSANVIDFPLFLQMGEIGNPFPEDFLSHDAIDNSITPMVKADVVKHSCLLVRALRVWSTAIEQLNENGEIMTIQKEIEDITGSTFMAFMFRPVPMVTNTHAPLTIETYGRRITDDIERVCVDLQMGISETVDLRAILEGALRYAGLECTADSDQAFLGLKILQSYRPPNNINGYQHEFLEEAIRRMVEKLSLMIVAADQSFPGVIRFHDGPSVFCVYPQGLPDRLQRIAQALGETNTLSDSEQCSNCLVAESVLGSKLKECTRCRQVKYCNRQCQREHWRRVHQRECSSNVTEASMKNS